MAGSSIPMAGLLLAILAWGGTASAIEVDIDAVQTVHLDLDLHTLCETLARACWDLDPDDFGMTPLSDVSPAEGLIGSAEWEAGFQVGLAVLGQAGNAAIRLNGSADLRHSGDDEPQGVPCTPGACPDLLVDARFMAINLAIDERNFQETHCAVAENATQPGTRRLLRFTFTTPNLGEADLVVGNPSHHGDLFEWGPCHAHWHFREYADYRLWTVPGYAAWQAIRAAHPGIPPATLLDAYPEVAQYHVAGHKQGFCMIDVVLYGPTALVPPRFTDCATNQGISRFWADSYHSFLDGQWIDITGLPPGAYVLEAEVNPERLFTETNYSNNAAALVVPIT